MVMAPDLETMLGRAPYASPNEETSAWADQKSAPSLYWRLPDGRVQLLKGGLNGADRMYLGAQPLNQYGMVTRATRDGKTDGDEFSVLWERGGIHELEPQQVFGLRWHRPPGRMDTKTHKAIWQQVGAYINRGFSEREALDEVLPQLRGVEIPEVVTCQYCHGREFLSRADLNKHESVMHRDDVRTREMRENLTDALKTQGQGMGDMAQLIQLMAQTLAAIGGQNAETKSMVEDLVRQIAPEPKRRGRPPKIVGDTANDPDDSPAEDS